MEELESGEQLCSLWHGAVTDRSIATVIPLCMSRTWVSLGTVHKIVVLTHRIAIRCFVLSTILLDKGAHTHKLVESNLLSPQGTEISRGGTFHHHSLSYHRVSAGREYPNELGLSMGHSLPLD